MGINTVLVTEYDEFEPILGVDSLAAELAATFRTYGIEPSTPAVPTHGRLDLVDLTSVMRAWTPSAQGSVVYWLGHGCGPRPGRLVHSGSKKSYAHDGVLPTTLVDDLYRIGRETGFIIVILEACRTEEFARALKEELRERLHMCPTLIIFSRDAVTVPRSVIAVLDKVLHETYGHDAEIYLAKVHAEIEVGSASTGIASEHLNLGSAALRSPVNLPLGQTLEVHRRLRDVLDSLSDDERSHFFAKAQSATTGELTWNFEGRDEERKIVRDWIDDESPLCVIEGAGGQGKSAFLGDIVTRCRPALHEALVRADLMNEDPMWSNVGHQVRTIAINASGLTAERLLNRTLGELKALTPNALAAGLTDVTDATTGDGLDELLMLIATTINLLNQRVLIIIDGIDEMENPYEGARIVASLATRSDAKVLAACRDEPNDGRPFLQYANSDLTQVIRGNQQGGTFREVRLHTDPDAIDRYLCRRLNSAYPDASIQGGVGRHVSDFLHANLLVQEVIAEPEWLSEGLLPDLAQADITELYGFMLDRLRRRNPAFEPIFQACALAQGRGLPIADEVWLTTARAIAGHTDGLTPKALSGFLDAAQSHIRIDSEHDQTVFRPAHSLLRQFLVNTLGNRNDVCHYHALLAELCAAKAASPRPQDAGGEAGTGLGSGNVYYQHAATMHARQSDHGGWWAIDRLGPTAWQHLNSQRIVEDAMRDLFGRTQIPQEVETLILSHHYTQLGPAAAVDGWPQALREGGLRPIRANGARPSSRANADARVRWARGLARQPVFLSLPGHRGRITALHQTELGPDEPGLLVGTASGDIWLWNIQSAGLVANLDGLDSAVFALSSIVTEAGLIVTAGDSSGRLIAWSAKTRQPLWKHDRGGDPNRHVTPTRRGVGSANPVTAAQLHKLYDEMVCVIAIHADRIRILNASDGSLITTTDPTASATGPRYAPRLAASTDCEGRHTLAVPARNELGYYPLTINNDGGTWTLKRHDLVPLAAEIVAIRPHPTAPNTFRLLTSEGRIIQSHPGSKAKIHSAMLASKRSDSDENNVDSASPITTGDLASPATALTHAHVDPDTGLLQIRTNRSGHPYEVRASHGKRTSAVIIIERPGQRPLLATGASDRTVRIWDPYSAPTDTQIATTALARHVHSLPAGNRGTLAISADTDGRIQFLNGRSARPIHTLPLRSPVTNLAASTGNPGRAIIAAATRAGTVHLWRQDGLEKPSKLNSLRNLGAGATVDIDPTGALIAVADNDCNITLWEPANLNRLLLHQTLQDMRQRPIAVKVHQPYGDLTVILVLTKELVQVVQVEGTGRRRSITRANRPHNLPDSSAHSLYIRDQNIGLLAGAADGQVHAIQELWTPRNGVDPTGRNAIPAFNLRQPVTAIHALQAPMTPISITTCGDYGRIKTAQTRNPVNVRTIELGQPVTAAHTHVHGQLLVAILGGTTLLDLGPQNQPLNLNPQA